MSKSSAYLFIDGTNLYAAQYELFGPERYLIFTRFLRETEEKIGIKFLRFQKKAFVQIEEKEVVGEAK